MTTVFEVLHRKAEPYKVELTRGQKGSYGWTITVSASCHNEAMTKIKNADISMREMFGGGDAHE